MMKLIRGIKNDKSGASAAEYALIVAIIGGGIIVAAGTFGSSISTALNNMGSKITTNSPK